MSMKTKTFAGLALVATAGSTMGMLTNASVAQAATADGYHIGVKIGTTASGAPLQVGNFWADNNGYTYCADEGSAHSGYPNATASSWSVANVTTFQETNDTASSPTAYDGVYVSPAVIARVNYVLTKYGTTTDPQMAEAVQNYVHQYTAGPAQIAEFDTHVWQYASATAKNDYNTIVADALHNAGPYTMNVVWTTKPTATSAGAGYVQVTSGSKVGATGIAVNLSATGDTVSPSSGTTDSNGRVYFTVPALGVSGGNVTVKATAPKVAGSAVKLYTPAGFPSSGIQRMVAAGPTTSLSASAAAVVAPVTIGTTATNAANGSNVVKVGDTVKDVVKYSGLTPGKTYLMVGRFVENGKQIAGGSGSTKFVASSTGSGSVVVNIPVPAGATAGSAYINEMLYNGTDTSVAPFTSANGATAPSEHVTVVTTTVSIGTVATDDADGDKNILAGGTADDTINYTGLTVGTTYNMHAQLVDSTGKVLGTADQSFTPTTADGSVKVQVTVPAGTPAQDVYFNETLQQNGTTVSFNSGKGDTNETLTVIGPTLATNAVNADNNTKYVSANGGTVADTVNYTGLTVGQQYTVNGSLYDQSTGDVISGATGSTTFTATSADGSVVVDIKVPAGTPTGADVAAESLSYNNTVIAVHNNLQDTAQTVNVVQVGTTATNAANGTNIVSSTGGTINDVIAYDGLVGGQTYTIQGTLMDQATGKSTGITTTGTFVADTDGTGSTTVTFKVPALSNNDSLVAYENLLLNGTVVASHADINSPSQTVSVVTPAKPVAPAVQTKKITVHYELDKWKMANKTATATADRVVADHLFKYREDVNWNSKTGKVKSAPLWAKGVHLSSVENTIVINVPVTDTPAQILAAEKTAIANATGVTAGKFATPTLGKTAVISWLIPNGAWDKTSTWKNAAKYGAQVEVGSKNI